MYIDIYSQACSPAPSLVISRPHPLSPCSLSLPLFLYPITHAHPCTCMHTRARTHMFSHTFTRSLTHPPTPTNTPVITPTHPYTQLMMKLLPKKQRFILEWLTET